MHKRFYIILLVAACTGICTDASAQLKESLKKFFIKGYGREVVGPDYSNKNGQGSYENQEHQEAQ